MSYNRIESFLKFTPKTFENLYKYTHFWPMKIQSNNEKSFWLEKYNSVIESDFFPLEKFKFDIITRHSVFNDRLCSGCFFDFVDCLLCHVYGKGLDENYNQLLLKESFLPIFNSFKSIIDYFLTNLKPQLITRHRFTKKTFYCAKFFKHFQKECNIIVDIFKTYKPLLHEYCCESIFIPQHDQISHCLRYGGYIGRVHTKFLKESRFFDTTSELFQKEYKNHPYNKHLTALKNKSKWQN